jgi:hypothetical protein
MWYAVFARMTDNNLPPQLVPVVVRVPPAVTLPLSLDTHQIEKSGFGTPWVICSPLLLGGTPPSDLWGLKWL